MKKNILTGIKPTGTPHIGNYFGAIKPALDMMSKGDANYFLFVADYHAYTSVKDPQLFQQYVHEIAATWLACGLDPHKVTFYAQVDIPELFELNWLLACNTPKGDLNRAHAYKALVQENIDQGNKDPDHGVNVGLYTYPILMAADILLFDSHFVPVGKDQIQHVEIARAIASRVNNTYKKEIFVEPKEIIQEEVATILGLDGRKMSKSYQNTIPLFLEEKKLQKLINRITTDSSGPEDPKDPDKSIIFSYYKLFGSKEEIQEFRNKLIKGISWGEAKAELFAVMNEKLKGPRAIYDSLMKDKTQVDRLLKEGAKAARAIAMENMQRFRKNLMGY